MGGLDPDHDRIHGTDDRLATLDRVLAAMRLSCAVFLRGEYTDPWSTKAVSGEDTAAVVHPQSERVAIFHVVATGRCWIALADGVKHWAYQGDVFVLPYGDVHTMGGPTHIAPVDLMTLLDPPPWNRLPVARTGGGGDETEVVCGYVATDAPLFDERLRALPPLFVVSLPEGAARDWVQASIDYSAQQTLVSVTGGLEGPIELAELLVRAVLKEHLLSTPASDSDWVSALDDSVLAPALAAIHGAPERKWTVSDLAKEANVSASLLDERFREVLHLAPIRYLAEWRMHVASDLLNSTTLSLAAVSHRVGYEAEEAFSRAFKRAKGSSPGAWRAAVR